MDGWRVRNSSNGISLRKATPESIAGMEKNVVL